MLPIWEQCITAIIMRIAGVGILFEFMRRHPDSKGPLETWIALVKAASWEKNTDIRQISGSASFLGDRRVVFNIKGRRYRLDVKVSYKSQVVQVIRIGTHAEYDKWRF